MRLCLLVVVLPAAGCSEMGYASDVAACEIFTRGGPIDLCLAAAALPPPARTVEHTVLADERGLRVEVDIETEEGFPDTTYRGEVRVRRNGHVVCAARTFGETPLSPEAVLAAGPCDKVAASLQR